MKILFLLLLTTSSFAQDKYVLPFEIIQAREKVLASKKKLDEDILKSYFNLCNKKQHTQAEHLEFLAYQQITKLECWQLTLL